MMSLSRLVKIGVIGLIFVAIIISIGYEENVYEMNYI